MELIPYHPLEGREIVLRHRNALVVYDPASKDLLLRGLTECPTCHRPFERSNSSRERSHSFDQPYNADPDSYIDPEYFRMLQHGVRDVDSPSRGPSSPVRGLVKPPPQFGSHTRSASASSTITDDINEGAEFVSSQPDPKFSQSESGKIRREAFSQGYFETFFKEERVLGRGGKGVVLLVRHEIDGVHLGEFACKRVPVGDDHAWLEKVLIEVMLLAKLSHPNLVSYRHVWLEDKQFTLYGPAVPCAFILQQYCNSGDLHQYVLGDAPQETSKEELKAKMRRKSKGQAEKPAEILSKPQLSFDEIYSLFKDITSGVSYLHASNYVHRDLKPNNCLLHREAGTLTCLISDFGEVQAENVTRKSTGSTGTISYCAPEVLKVDQSGRYGNFTSKSDIFSLGMILYFMCFSRLPYRSANVLQEELEDVDKLRDEIMTWKGFQDERRERPDLPSKLFVLLAKLLAINPAERPAAADVLSAMRSESNFEGLARGEATSSSHPLNNSNNLHVSRVQNLDSPAAASSPAPDSQRQQRRGRSVAQDGAGPWPRSRYRDETPLANNEGIIQRRRVEVPSQESSQAMVLSPSQQVFRPSISSERDEYATQTSDSAEPFPTTPLLLAPPSRGSGFITRLVNPVLFRTNIFVSRHYHVINPAARLAIFGGKVISLSRPCWPYVPASRISIPLLCMAAFDFGLSESTFREGRVLRSRKKSIWGLWASGLLLLVHFLILWISGRYQMLCMNTSRDPWSGWEEINTAR